MFGLLNVDKPTAWSSRDVVNRVERLVRPDKAGHAGTLDPLATGVLIIGIGQATRLVEYVQRMPKTYRGTFLLGRTSDTEDVAGNVVELPGAVIPTREHLDAVLPRFLGTIEQRPPAYSALKVRGQSAYKRARRGEAVMLEPRRVNVYWIEALRYEYPELELLVICGGGTYMRSLGRDIAEALGTGAVMSALRRLAIGPFTVENAIAGDDLAMATIESRLLLPITAVTGLPQVRLGLADIARVARGQQIVVTQDSEGEEIAALDEHGGLVAILKRAGARRLAPLKYFAAAR